MKNKLIIISVIFALVIILGVVSIFVTDIGGIDFSKGNSLVITNKLYNEQGFEDYIKKLDAEFATLGVKPQSKQLLNNAYDEVLGVSYEFYALNQEQLKAIGTSATNDNVIVKSLAIDGSASKQKLVMASIGVGVLLVIQFLYYLIFNKSTNGVRSGLVATCLTLLAVIFACGIALTLCLIGIKFAVLTAMGIFGVAFVSIFTNAYIFSKLNIIAKQNVKNVREHKDLVSYSQAIAESRTPLTAVYMFLSVALVILGAIGMFSLLSVVVTALLGIYFAGATSYMFLLPLWEKNQAK
ncbi:MAG: hypothetical protein RR248_03000 [Clostridia bacterium]